LRFRAIATDYDSTLATEGHAFPPALNALREAQAAGRKLILVTGRELESLRSVFPGMNLFDLVVAENGALLFFPRSSRERLLCQAVPNGLLTNLQQKGVTPLSAGRCVIATVTPQEQVVEQTIEQLHLHWQIIMNRESVMVLPRGINKGTGFTAAMAELGLMPKEAMCIGDAENDHDFLRICGLSVAVGNSIPSLKEEADFVTKGERGAGVVEALAHLREIDPW
jgi:phosphoglycolate phosphatase (TIGR01487 family)